jgi:hypothetical protein
VGAFPPLWTRTRPSSTLLLNPSALGGYVGRGVATAAADADGETGSVGDDAARGAAPPHVTRTSARVTGAADALRTSRLPFGPSERWVPRRLEKPKK